MQSNTRYLTCCICNLKFSLAATLKEKKVKLIGNINQKGAFLVAQMVRILPAMQDTGFDLWVQKPPGEGNATHSGILA